MALLAITVSVLGVGSDGSCTRGKRSSGNAWFHSKDQGDSPPSHFLCCNMACAVCGKTGCSRGRMQASCCGPAIVRSRRELHGPGGEVCQNAEDTGCVLAPWLLNQTGRRTPSWQGAGPSSGFEYIYPQPYKSALPSAPVAQTDLPDQPASRRHRHKRHATTKGHGKEFLPSGAWTVSDDYAKSAKQKCDDCIYKLDRGLALCLARFFGAATVTELGAGVGRYAKFIEKVGLGAHVTAYDGMPDVEVRSKGRVQHADLAFQPSLSRSDWAMSLEVAEHIPAQFESNFLRNIDCANRQGVVLSWSELPERRGGIGHVNARNRGYVPRRMRQRGYEYNRNASSVLRSCAAKHYLRSGILVFERAPGREHHVNCKGPVFASTPRTG